jgi:hypothetical protein
VCLVIAQITFARRAVPNQEIWMPAWVIVLWLQAAAMAKPAAPALAPSPYEAAARVPGRRDVRLGLVGNPYAARRAVSRVLALAPDPYDAREHGLPLVRRRVRVAVQAPYPDSQALQALAPSPYGVAAFLLAPMPY